jgi:hypothetical protein
MFMEAAKSYIRMTNELSDLRSYFCSTQLSKNAALHAYWIERGNIDTVSPD